jgi:flagellin-like protein
MKLKWKEDAVSPVIATILMVAITVVLAAVLYVMVIGMGGSAVVQTPVGSWQKMDTLSKTSVSMTFGQFQPNVEPFDVRLIVESQTGYIFNLTFPSLNIDDDNYTMSCDGVGITAYYYDLNPGGRLINAGDHIQIYGLNTFTVYEVKIYHYPSDSIVQMAGDTSFQTLP